MHKFIQKMKLKQFAKSMQCVINEGDVVDMYSNTYTVLNNLSDNYIIMVDGHGQKTAFPKSGLAILLNKGVATLNNEIQKANGIPGGTGQGPGKRAVPIGTISRGRRKIKEGVWVDVSTGSAHSGHHENASQHGWHENMPDNIRKQAKDLTNRSKDMIHPKFHGEMTKVLTDHIKSETELHHMEQHVKSEFKAGSMSLSNADTHLQSKKREVENFKKTAMNKLKELAKNPLSKLHRNRKKGK